MGPTSGLRGTILLVLFAPFGLPAFPGEAAAQSRTSARYATHPRHTASRRAPMKLFGAGGHKRMRYEERHWFRTGRSREDNVKIVDNICASSACTPPGSSIRITSQGRGRAKIVGKAAAGTMGTVTITFAADEGGIRKRISSKASVFVPFPMRGVTERTMVGVHHIVAPVERVLGDAIKKTDRRKPR